MKRHACLILLPALLVACQRNPEATPAPAAEAAAAQPAANEPVAATSPPPAPGATPATPAARTGTEPVLEGIPRKIEMPAEAPKAALAPETDITYVCESGSPLRVSYSGIVARIAWTGGRALTLSRAQGAGTDEIYSGDGHTLLRRGSVIELSRSGGTQRWRCEEAEASA